MGQPYTLEILHTNNPIQIVLTQTTLQMFVKENIHFLEKEKLLNDWFYSQMQQRLPSLSKKWESIIGVKPNAYTIKNLKSRWGSCHLVKKEISLNLKLIQKPETCLEYVLVHELVHLLEPSHNARFHALMSHYIAPWKSIKKLLNG